MTPLVLTEMAIASFQEATGKPPSSSTSFICLPTKCDTCGKAPLVPPFQHCTVCIDWDACGDRPECIRRCSKSDLRAMVENYYDDKANPDNEEAPSKKRKRVTTRTTKTELVDMASKIRAFKFLPHHPPPNRKSLVCIVEFK